MKVSHGKLEEARRNPSSLKAGPGTEFYSFGRYRALQYSIYKAHDQGLDAGIAHLAALYHKHFKRPEGLRPLETILRRYHAEFRSLDNVVLQKNARMRFDLTTDDQVTGEIPRIDLVPTTGGAALWLFGRIRGEWEAELRMPILQLWLAQQLGANLEDVTVGFYFLDSAVYESRCYTDAEVGQAVAELLRVLQAA